MRQGLIAGALFIVSLTAPALAQRWVVVDKDATSGILRGARRNLRELRRLANNDVYMLRLVRRLRRKLKRLHRRLRHARPATVSGPVAAYPAVPSIGPAAFGRLLGLVASTRYATDQLRELRGAAKVHRFSVRQIARILDVFRFDSDRLAALRVLAHTIVDPARAYRLRRHFRYAHYKRRAGSVLRRWLGVSG